MQYHQDQKQKYYKIPKVLLTDQFDCLSTDAVLLYGILSDRTSLSRSNACNDLWTTQQGEIYVYCTLVEIQHRLRCGHDKATKTCRELELVGLIKRIALGCGKTYQIIVYPPFSRSEENAIDNAINTKYRSEKSANNNTNKLLLTDSNCTTGQIPTGLANNSQTAYEEWDLATAYNKFYEFYPNHRRDPYDQGLAIYQKLVVSQAHANKIQDSLAQWIICSMWKQDGGRYVPSLRNFLLRGYADKQPPISKSILWASERLGEEELEAIHKIMDG